MTVKNDFSIESNFATWYFSENAPLGSGKIVLNRHFALNASPVYVEPLLISCSVTGAFSERMERGSLFKMRSSRAASRKEGPVECIASQFASQLACEERIGLLEDPKAAIAEELAQGRTGEPAACPRCSCPSFVKRGPVRGGSPRY